MDALQHSSDSFDLVRKAAGCAAKAHTGQYRPDGTPFAVHPIRVCLTLRQLFGIDDQAALCAALLHDVMEKGGVNYDELFADFGEEVADLVAGMTKDFRLKERDREAEFELRLREGPWKLKAIKLADAYDNLSDRKPGALEKAERVATCAETENRLTTPVGILRDLIASEAALNGGRDNEE